MCHANVVPIGAARHKACKRELRRSALMPADIAIRQFKATAPVKHQQEECQMAYLELSPAIAALRARPEEFEFSNDTLHHVRSRHRFHFVSEDDVQIHADCDCSLLRASREQTKVFHTAYREWYACRWPTAASGASATPHSNTQRYLSLPSLRSAIWTQPCIDPECSLQRL